MKMKGISLFSLIILVISAAFLTSCDKHIEMIPASAVLTLPSVTTRNLNTVFDDSGKVQLILKTPILEKYDNVKEPYTEFRLGLNVLFYDGNPEPVGSVTAKYGKYIESKKLWELRDSVVVINKNNEKLETELLYWNQQKDLIYTERFVKFTTEDQIITGTGFESDSHLTKRKISHPSGIIYINDTNEE
jgi:LPS export ABC transporter protein LptC